MSDKDAEQPTTPTPTTTTTEPTTTYASRVDSIVETIRRVLLGLPPMVEKLKSFFVK